jgi:hypothetical protein
MLLLMDVLFAEARDVLKTPCLTLGRDMDAVTSAEWDEPRSLRKWAKHH